MVEQIKICWGGGEESTGGTFSRGGGGVMKIFFAICAGVQTHTPSRENPVAPFITQNFKNSLEQIKSYENVSF